MNPSCHSAYFRDNIKLFSFPGNYLSAASQKGMALFRKSVSQEVNCQIMPISLSLTSSTYETADNKLQNEVRGASKQSASQLAINLTEHPLHQSANQLATSQSVSWASARHWYYSYLGQAQCPCKWDEMALICLGTLIGWQTDGDKQKNGW